jgi:hypothetical protein
LAINQSKEILAKEILSQITMKILIVLLLTFFCYTIANSQRKSQIPILIDTVETRIDITRPRLQIVDNVLSEPSCIRFRVVVDFRFPIDNRSQSIQVMRVTLKQLEIDLLKTKKHISLFSSSINNCNDQSQTIWQHFQELFNTWYRNQPYKKWINKQSIQTRGYFGGVLYTSPR